MPATSNTLPDTDFHGKVRAHDPDTSWDAAAGQTRTKTRMLRRALVAVLNMAGPLTDSELVARYEDLQAAHPDFYDRATPQSVRSRRSELCILGEVIDSGEKRPSDYNNPSTVWKLK